MTYLLVFALGIAAGVAAVYLRNTPTRDALWRLREAGESRLSGDWKYHVSPAPGAPKSIRELIRLYNESAAMTLRQLKDLSRRQEDLQALVDALPDAVLLADTRRKIILINEPAEQLLGVPTNEALGRSIEAALNEPAVLQLFDRAATIELEDTHENGEPMLPLKREVNLTRDGKRRVFQAVLTRSGAGGVLLMLRDISKISDTLRMKADFVANASHELRTPVAAIKASFETLEEIVESGKDSLPAHDAEDLSRCTTILGGHLQRMEDMLRDLLDLSRAESGDQQPSIQDWDLRETMRDLRQTLTRDAEAKQIELDLPARSFPLHTDPRVLSLALKNLVENAIKYTPPGGKVRLEVVDDASFVDLRVIDSGVGLSPENLERVFERFFQVDPARSGTNPRTSGRGTGLGLSIVKHAAASLGGRVIVDSQLGQGSTFTLRLPKRAPATLPPAE